MIRLDQPDRCAFCGRLIEPGEQKSGRGEAAAHVACADAALGDDRFWDRIAAGMGDASPAAPEPGGSETGGSETGGGPQERPATSGGKAGTGARSGCLVPGVLVVIGLLLAEETTRHRKS